MARQYQHQCRPDAVSAGALSHSPLPPQTRSVGISARMFVKGATEDVHLFLLARPACVLLFCATPLRQATCVRLARGMLPFAEDGGLCAARSVPRRVAPGRGGSARVRQHRVVPLSHLSSLREHISTASTPSCRRAGVSTLFCCRFGSSFRKMFASKAPFAQPLRRAAAPGKTR